MLFVIADGFCNITITPKRISHHSGESATILQRFATVVGRVRKQSRVGVDRTGPEKVECATAFPSLSACRQLETATLK
jgi:hypothetical protein